jgi:hypothetical protein
VPDTIFALGEPEKKISWSYSMDLAYCTVTGNWQEFSYTKDGNTVDKPSFLHENPLNF